MRAHDGVMALPAGVDLAVIDVIHEQILPAVVRRVAGELLFGAGDRVRHVKFGDGTVTEIKEGGRDYEVTVQFDTAGVRKMFALFAKLIKI